MSESSFTRWGGRALIGVGVCSLLYGALYVGLIVLADPKPPAEFAISFGAQSTNLLLALSGLFGIVGNVALFERLRKVSEGWARATLWLGAIAALLGGLHGWFAFVQNPVLAQLYSSSDTSAAARVIGDLPSVIDPRGLGTFGLAGLSLLIVSQLLPRVDGLPRRLASLALLAAALLGLIFLGTVLWAGGSGPAFARFLFLVPGPIQSIIVGPIFYIWLGRHIAATS
jgi:hypothetical protein